MLFCSNSSPNPSTLSIPLPFMYGRRMSEYVFLVSNHINTNRHSYYGLASFLFPPAATAARWWTACWAIWEMVIDTKQLTSHIRRMRITQNTHCFVSNLHTYVLCPTSTAETATTTLTNRKANQYKFCWIKI